MAQIPDLQSYNLIYRWDKWQAREIINFAFSHLQRNKDSSHIANERKNSAFFDAS